MLLGAAVLTLCSAVDAVLARPALDLLQLQVFAKQSIEAERSDYQGPTAAGGTIELSDFEIGGDLTAGGRVSFDRGHVVGFVRSPDVRMTRVFSSGAGPAEGGPFDLISLKLDLLGARMAALRPTSRVEVGRGADGKTEFRATARGALEVVDLAGDQLNASGEDRTRLVFVGDKSAKLLVRVHGRSVQMRHVDFAVSGGLDPSRIVLFFPDARALDIVFSGGARDENGGLWDVPGSIVAPDAALRFAATTVTGQVFAQSITAMAGLPGGQVDRLPSSPGKGRPITPSQLLQGIGDTQLAAASRSDDDGAAAIAGDAAEAAGCRLVCRRSPQTPD